MAQSEAPSKSEAEYTRLHITPFEPNLLKAILPPSILPNARNISYHTIATFPEKAYGFVDLPVMDAEKIKKKLNGAILKGTKVRVEKARPEKEGLAVVEEEVKMSKKEKKLSKKRKRDDTIPAAEILDRSVKRGWTTPLATAYSKDKEKRVNKSKFTTGPECLFKTVIPANVATGSKAAATDKVERKRHKAGKEAIVHEFAKTTKYATFLRSTAAGNKKISAEFAEGKGWVDEDGNVIEEVTIKMVKTSESKKPDTKSEPVAEEENESGSDSSDGDSSDSASSSDEDDEDQKEEQDKLSIDKPDKPATKPAPISAPPTVEDSETSSSGSSSEDSESDSDSEDSSKAESDEEKESSSESENETVDSKPASRPQSSSGAPLNLSIKIPVPEITTTPVPPAEVHPLEALFKRPKPNNKDLAPKPAPSSFSFFGADDDIDEAMEEESQDKVPLTPFTQRDFEYRGMRSAAPTPDTAHANKKFLWPSVHDEDVDDDHTPTSPTRQQKKGESSKTKPKDSKVKEEGAAPETDFQKWFYENRGDTNRAWKKRRKVVGKEKRHRENKKRSERV